MNLRFYQEEAVYSIYDYFAGNDGNPVIALPTGTGKSLVIASFLQGALAAYPGTRVIMATHVKELIQQNLAEFIQVWPLAPVGVYSAGLKIKQVAPITFGGIASMAKKASAFGHIDLVLIDECHLLSPHDDTLYRTFIADLRATNPKLKVIGLTATPYRLGQGLLTEAVSTPKGEIKPPLFTDICCDWTSFEKFNRLIAEGFLCPLIPKRTQKQVDVSKVHLIAGEFNLSELQAEVDKDEITRAAIDELITTAEAMPHSCGRARLRWLIFASGVEHSDHIAQELESRGIWARSIHSKTPAEARAAWIAEFKQSPDDNVLRVLVNNNVLTTGFNAPAIDVIGMLRWTNSPGLWVQMLGRGTRIFFGKDNCLVMDFAGNTKRLGPINDPVIPKKRGRGSSNGAPVKLCEHCGTFNHASVRFCTHCGEEFPENVKIQEEASDEELIRSAAPAVEIFQINRVEYRRHIGRNGRPDSLKVSYWSGPRMFSQWVCLEHEGFAGKKARDWWRERAENPEADPPETIGEALDGRVQDLAEPTHMRVWVNKTHPEILAFDFSGTAFGTEKIGLAQKINEEVPF